MISHRLPSASLCIATFVLPHTSIAQTHLGIESLVLNTYTDTADFQLLLQSNDLAWRTAGSGKSEADLALKMASLDSKGDVLTGRQQSLTIKANTGDAAELARVSTRLSADVKIPIKTDKVRFSQRPQNAGFFNVTLGSIRS